MKVVLDANVFVSAVIESQGKPSHILDAWRHNRFALLLRDDILAEISGVLQRPHLQKRHRWNESDTERFVEGLRELAIMTNGKLQVAAVADDPDDDMYVACAVEGEADYIVSGDHHLQQLASYHGIRIISPTMFLNILAE